MSFAENNIPFITDSPLFDPNWYTLTYPDVPQTKISPAEHYLRFGAMLGRDPGPGFSTSDYIEMYPDVAHARMNPLVHYERRKAVEPGNSGARK